LQKLIHPTTKIRTVKKNIKICKFKKNLPKKLSVGLLGQTIRKTKGNELLYENLLEPLEGQCGGQEA
jgi:hypothetical protein